MHAINALIYVMGIYGLTFLITLLVGVVIILIRWASSDRVSMGALNARRRVGKWRRTT